MAILEIPVVITIDSYEFPIILEQVTYFLQFKYNGRRSRWLMDILDQDKTPLLIGVAMLTNVDMFLQFKDQDLPPGIFLIFDLLSRQKNPEQFDLGDTIILLYEELGTTEATI